MFTAFLHCSTQVRYTRTMGSDAHHCIHRYYRHLGWGLYLAAQVSQEEGSHVRIGQGSSKLRRSQHSRQPGRSWVKGQPVWQPRPILLVIDGREKIRSGNLASEGIGERHGLRHPKAHNQRCFPGSCTLTRICLFIETTCAITNTPHSAFYAHMGLLVRRIAGLYMR